MKTSDTISDSAGLSLPFESSAACMQLVSLTSKNNLQLPFVRGAVASKGPGSSPSHKQCVVFLGETLYSHSASLQPGA